jgi:hypothetical protein
MSEILTAGKDDFDVLIVADGHPPGGTHIMKDREQSLLVKQLRMAGITASRCHIITPCPAVPQEISKSAKRSAEWIMERHDMFWEEFTPLLETAKVVLILGKTAAHQVMGKSVPVTKNRGVFMDIPKIPCKSLITLSPTHVLVRPEVLPDFETDIGKLGRFVSAGFVDEATDIEEGDYRIVTDLSFLLDKPPTALALDTETSGLDWAGDARVLMAQISVREGESFIIPFSPERFPDIPRNDIMRGINHLRTLLAKPSVRVFGHNLKFDLHMLRKHRIRVANWWMETMQLAFAMDENMQSKNLDECVRRWVPEMAGYADCVVPETEILTYDMRKVKAGSLKVGDKLCAFTAETNGKKACRRKMAVSTVLGVQKLTRPCLKITTESGRSIIVSRGHLFLCKHGLSDKGGGWRWRRADGLTVGSVLKPFPWEDHETDFDAGYVSGIFDGEGWLHSGRSRIGVAQKPGVVLDNFKRILLGNSIFWGHSTDKRKDVPVVNVTFDGHDCFKILQKFRPLRLLENCSWEGCGLPTNGHKHDRIVSIVDAGSREVVGLKTSTQTIIAEGLLSHNSFNAEVDKSKMAEVDLSKLIKYAGGDTDATFRLCKRLVSEVKQDKPQWRTVVKVQMPVLRMFFEMEERGICIDSNKLSSFGKELSDREEILYKELVDLVPRKVRQKHFSKGLSFSRADLIIDILFSEDGYGLCPKMFTKGSTEGSMKPSTDSKHLSNFPNNPFVQKFSEYQKIQKMRSTYVGERGGLAAKEISLLKSGKFPAKFARIVEEEN